MPIDQDNITLATVGAAVPSNRSVEHDAGVPRNTSTDTEDRQLLEFSLPRVDGGKDAWLFLAGCFTLEALIWGKCHYMNMHLRIQ